MLSKRLLETVCLVLFGFSSLSLVGRDVVTVDTMGGKTMAHEDTRPVCELHVLIHGTFGSAVTLLSYPLVKKDTLHDTAYLKLQRLMRHSKLGQHHRILGELGLHEIMLEDKCPSGNLPTYYVASTHDAIRREVSAAPAHEHRYFIFGWNGLLSQRERRRESIRLYNELVSKVAQLEAAGFRVELDLTAHSHGCNVVLNLALIHACLFAPDSLPATTDRNVVTCMLNLLDGGAAADLSAILGDANAQQAAHLYRKPTRPLPVIDRVTLLAIPVQPETAPFIISPLFASVVQVYSENDGVIVRDILSSVAQSTMLFDPELIKGHDHIKVVRWMNNRTPLDFCRLCDEKKYKVQPSRVTPFKDLTQARMKRLKNGGGNPDSHHQYDPTHADFWSVGNKRDGMFFESVPLLVYLPLVHNLLQEVDKEAQFFDFCLMGRDNNQRAEGLLYRVHEHKKADLCAHREISLEPVNATKVVAKKLMQVRSQVNVALNIKSPFKRKSGQNSPTA
jgi:hypothetical protein